MNSAHDDGKRSAVCRPPAWPVAPHAVRPAGQDAVPLAGRDAAGGGVPLAGRPAGQDAVPLAGRDAAGGGVPLAGERTLSANRQQVLPYASQASRPEVLTRAGQRPVRPAGQDAPPLTEQEAVEHVHGICFKTGPPGRVGVELEWLVHDLRDPGLPVLPERVSAALAGLDSPGALPARGWLTTEPGGQLELSSRPAASIAECVAATALDLAAVREALHAEGLHLVGRGVDPLRPPRRVLDSPRYAAMEEFFDRSGPAGRAMMCSTASVQVCLDAGDNAGEQSYRRRWHLLNTIAPVLVAAFANSPVRLGHPTGWRSTRQAIWADLDPGRTRPVAGWCAGYPQDASRRDAGYRAGPGPRAGGGMGGARQRAHADRPRGTGPAGVPGPGVRAGSGTGPVPFTAADPSADPRAQWADYALDAELLCIRRPGSRAWLAPPGLTFRGWLRGVPGQRPPRQRPPGPRPPGDAALHPPTIDDLDYHLSTLFPPVRPRGHLELRVIDAQLFDGWVVPAAVTAALLDDPGAGAAAMAAAEPLWSACSDPWQRSARHGPADPEIGRAAKACFEAACGALGRSGVPEPLLRAVTEFADRYVLRNRCPADDLLEEMA